MLASALLPGHPRDSPESSEPTVAATSQTVAAAMLERVRSLIPGAASDFAGQDRWLPSVATDGTAVAARFRFTPVATGDPGWIVIRLQVPAPTSSEALSCATQPDRGEGPLLLGCLQERLADGTVVRHYSTRSVQEDGTVLVERTAEAVHDEGVLVSATAANTADPRYGVRASRALNVSGRPPLLAEQLQQITLWGGWGEKLPAKYAEQADQLASFDDSPQSW